MNEYNFIVDETSDGKRIDVFLSEQIDELSRSYAKKLLDDEMVTINKKTAKANSKLKINDSIIITIPDAQTLDVTPDSSIELDVLYEDDDVLVINKPQDLVVHPAVGNHSGTLVNAIMAHCGDNLSQINGVIRPGIVHRIDKDTSGVLVIAKNNKAHLSLAEQIKEHTINRKYIAIVNGNIIEDTGIVNAPIGRHHIDRKKMAVVEKERGREAVTHFKVLERFRKYTLLELKLETGRTHQIRVHMAYINHPVLGDPVYGTKKCEFSLKGQVLHAKILGFIHPTKNEYMEFNAPIPEYFQKLINILRAKY